MRTKENLVANFSMAVLEGSIGSYKNDIGLILDRIESALNNVREGKEPQDSLRSIVREAARAAVLMR